MPQAADLEPFLKLIAALLAGRTAPSDERQAVLEGLSPAALRTARTVVGLAERHAVFERRMTQTARLAEVGMAMAELVHELRQPLAAISGFAQLMGSNLANHPASRGVRDILQQTARMEAQIGRLRRFLRDEDEPGAGPCPVAEAIQEALAIQPKMPPGVDLEVQVAEGLPPALGARGPLVQVLTNLLSNARQAMADREQGRVSLSAARDGDRIEIRVADDGPGIAATFRSRLFEPFATTKGEEGTGLGLYISRSILEGWGGSLDLVEMPPFSTAFAVRLRAALPPEETRPPAASPAAFAQAAREMRAAGAAVRLDRRVLVVDDHLPSRRALRVLLAAEPGLQLVEAPDGPTAIAELERAGAQVLLLDLRLPGSSGTDLLRWARDRDLPIEALVLTGHPSAQSVGEALDLGVADYLTRPIERADALRLRVREGVARSRRWSLSKALAADSRIWARRLLTALGSAGAPQGLREALGVLESQRQGPVAVAVTGCAGGAEAVARSGHQAHSLEAGLPAHSSPLDGPEVVLIGEQLALEQALELTRRCRSMPWPVEVAWARPAGDFAQTLAVLRAGAGARIPRPIEPSALGPALARLAARRREQLRALALERVLDALACDDPALGG